MEAAASENALSDNATNLARLAQICDCIVFAAWDDGVADGIIHAAETLNHALWGFNEEVPSEGFAGGNINGVDVMVVKAKLHAASLVAFFLVMQKSIITRDLSFHRDVMTLAQRNEWYLKMIEELHLQVKLGSLTRIIQGIDRSWALELMHEKKVIPGIRDPKVELKQSGINQAIGNSRRDRALNRPPRAFSCCPTLFHCIN